MEFLDTQLHQVKLIRSPRLKDERGWFNRTWCRKSAAAAGIQIDPIQMNLSFNKSKGTLRGMHYQAEPHGEAKVVGCLTGAIFDVVIDLRPDSPTFRKFQAFELNQDEPTQLYIPKGLAHGFLTLTDNTRVSYLMGAAYVPGSARGIRWDDPAFKIPWPFPPVVVSEKDGEYPNYQIT